MTSLSAELNRFCEFSKRTKEILGDTKRVSKGNQKASERKSASAK
jgi:hypothetical protein